MLGSAVDILQTNVLYVGGYTQGLKAAHLAEVLRLPIANFFFQAEDGIRDYKVTGVQTCALPIFEAPFAAAQDGWTLRGVIDRVDAPAEAAGAWRIVDYKTGSPVPASRLRRDLQLALYAVGARQALHLDPVELEIVYLKDGQRVVVPATDELLAQARQIGAEAAEGIRSG